MTDRNPVDRNAESVTPGSTPDAMATPPVNISDPQAPAATPDPSGQTQDEPYSSEQAQRQKDAEQGRQAQWVATDPVD